MFTKKMRVVYNTMKEKHPGGIPLFEIKYSDYFTPDVYEVYFDDVKALDDLDYVYVEETKDEEGNSVPVAAFYAYYFDVVLPMLIKRGYLVAVVGADYMKKLESKTATDI